jgi:DNA-binding GntR family transcriptional regulator
MVFRIPNVRDERPSRRAVAAWTTEALYRAIYSGEIFPGTTLVESELTEMLNVSRSPVREALRELELNRLVVTDSVNGQRVVAAFGADDIEELYALRATLERLAHERAAKRLEPKDIAALEAALAEMLAADIATSSGRAEHFAADFRFHEAVAQAAQMPRLLASLRPLWIQTRALLRQLDAAGVYSDKAEVGQARDDHRAILDALLAGDSDGAATRAVRHLESRAHVLVAGVREHGGLLTEDDRSNAASTDKLLSVP